MYVYICIYISLSLSLFKKEMAMIFPPIFPPHPAVVLRQQLHHPRGSGSGQDFEGSDHRLGLGSSPGRLISIHPSIHLSIYLIYVIYVICVIYCILLYFIICYYILLYFIIFYYILLYFIIFYDSIGYATDIIYIYI